MKNLCRGNFKFILFIRKSRASYDFGTAPISFRYFYNWTMNFRRDSDIVDSYGPFVAKLGARPATTSHTYVVKPKGILTST